MASKPKDFAIPAGYGVSSPTDARRIFSDLISRAIDMRLYPRTKLFAEVYATAAELTSGCCFYCNSKLYNRENKRYSLIQGTYAWDHFVPASRYGLFIEGNVVLACAVCNLEKSDSSAEEYWTWRKNNKLPLRIKTSQEFYEVQKSLTELEATSNIANFYPETSDEGLVTDVLEASTLLGASDVAKEFLEMFEAGRVKRWTRRERADSHVLRALDDIENDAEGLWNKFETEAHTSYGFYSRRDVSARISQFVATVEDVTSKDDLRSLTKSEFRAVIKFILEAKRDSINETQKYKRLIRVISCHEELEHLKSVAWDQEVMA